MSRSKEPPKGKAGNGKICSTCPGTGEVIRKKNGAIKLFEQAVGFTNHVLVKCPECKGKGDWRGKR